MNIPRAFFLISAAVTVRRSQTRDESLAIIAAESAVKIACSLTGFAYSVIYFKLAGRRRPPVKVRKLTT
jgi:hypothetical protein